MTYIRVEPSVLSAVSTRLLDAVAVAEQVKNDRDGLKGLVDGEHDVVRRAVHSFLDDWAYGCGCLIEDATQTAARLERAGECYLEVEDSLAAAYGTEAG